MGSKKISYNADNAKALCRDYFGHPAKFLEDIVCMELDGWQKDFCHLLGKHERIAVSSGHSSGKSALSSGLIQYFLTMHPTPKITVTANTAQQLSQKTWRELAKWHEKSLLTEWFEWSATKYHLKGEAATWFAAAVPWSEHKAESFQGDHELYLMQIFDEASAIPYSIYEANEGATATEGGYRWWILFGNPTQNSGPFYDACFGSQSHRWKRLTIDTRGCKYADQAQIKRWSEDYGEDSDFFRVRVLGLAPQQSLTTLIPLIDVDRAIDTELGIESYGHAPKILGVDCARFGDDETVIAFRQGLKLHWLRAFRQIDEMQIAAEVYKAMKEVEADAVFFDVTGNYGIGGYDKLKSYGYKNVHAINFASKANDKQYANRRAEMWCKTREWLAGRDGQPQIPNDKNLKKELISPEYSIQPTTGAILLEKKEDVKKRLKYSPDRADAVVLTFAEDIRRCFADSDLVYNIDCSVC